MKISIVNSQNIVKLNSRQLKGAAFKTLSFIKKKNAELSIYIVDDCEIKYLNYRYRGVDRPTDVLAFSMTEGEELKGAEGILGDVVISAQTALRQARGNLKKTIDEINLYLVHGILHLIGYDDDSAKSRKKMEDMQNNILERLNTKRGLK